MTDNPYPSRKKMRFTGFDYKTQGCYFITVVTFNRTCLFGHVENEEMILSNSGKMIDHIYHTYLQNYIALNPRRWNKDNINPHHDEDVDHILSQFKQLR